MELRHLRYFLAVADELHFGRAAERLHMAQPPLSQQIQRLESELGVTLFERNRRQVTLTQAGELLRTEARRTIAQAERLVDVARDVRTGGSGRVRLGFVGSALYGILPPMLKSLRASAPGISVPAVELESGPQFQALRNDTLDLGVVRPPAVLPALAVQVIAQEELVAVLSDDHRLAGAAAIRLDELRDEQFVLFAPQHGEGYWQVVVRICGAAGFAPRIGYEAEHVHTMVGLVAAGLGVSLVPAAVARLNLSGVRYLPLQGGPFQLPLALAWDPGRSFPALERVIELLIEQSRRLTA